MRSENLHIFNNNELDNPVVSPCTLLWHTATSWNSSAITLGYLSKPASLSSMSDCCPGMTSLEAHITLSQLGLAGDESVSAKGARPLPLAENMIAMIYQQGWLGDTLMLLREPRLLRLPKVLFHSMCFSCLTMGKSWLPVCDVALRQAIIGYYILADECDKRQTDHWMSYRWSHNIKIVGPCKCVGGVAQKNSGQWVFSCEVSRSTEACPKCRQTIWLPWDAASSLHTGGSPWRAGDSFSNRA